MVDVDQSRRQVVVAHLGVTLLRAQQGLDPARVDHTGQAVRLPGGTDPLVSTHSFVWMGDALCSAVDYGDADPCRAVVLGSLDRVGGHGYRANGAQGDGVTYRTARNARR